MLEDLADIDLNRLTDSELLAVIELPVGQDGLRHYMSKADKIAFLSDETTHPEILERARKAQLDHHAYLRDRRARGGKRIDKPALIEAKLGNAVWRYVGRVRIPATFRDEVIHRKATVAYQLENIATGARLRVTKSTVADAHERLGNILNWPPPRGARAKPPVEGENTIATLPDRYGIGASRKR